MAIMKPETRQQQPTRSIQMGRKIDFNAHATDKNFLKQFRCYYYCCCWENVNAFHQYLKMVDAVCVCYLHQNINCVIFWV